MSASNEWTEWHLTSAGWVRGTEKLDFSRTDREPPADRVLTVVYREYISSSFSPMDKSVETTWTSKNADDVAGLLKQYGPSPNKI